MTTQHSTLPVRPSIDDEVSRDESLLSSPAPTKPVLPVVSDPDLGLLTSAYLSVKKAYLDKHLRHTTNNIITRSADLTFSGAELRWLDALSRYVDVHPTLYARVVVLSVNALMRQITYRVHDDDALPLSSLVAIFTNIRTTLTGTLSLSPPEILPVMTESRVLFDAMRGINESIKNPAFDGMLFPSVFDMAMTRELQSTIGAVRKLIVTRTSLYLRGRQTAELEQTFRVMTNLYFLDCLLTVANMTLTTNNVMAHYTAVKAIHHLANSFIGVDTDADLKALGFFVPPQAPISIPPVTSDAVGKLRKAIIHSSVFKASIDSFSPTDAPFAQTLKTFVQAMDLYIGRHNSDYTYDEPANVQKLIDIYEDSKDPLDNILYAQSAFPLDRLLFSDNGKHIQLL